MKLKPYMVSDGEPQEGALLAFHYSKRQAESLAYPEIKAWCDEAMRTDIVARRLEERPDIMDQATSTEPHVIDSPRDCPSCSMWGGEPRFDDTLCEFCEDEDREGQR